MVTHATDEDSVLISLSATSPESLPHPERRIILTVSRPTLQIGRSSNRSSMGMCSDISNGWFDSPVMSRHHAEIKADFATQRMSIRDAGSMHGTLLNGDKVGSEEARQLAAGDEVKFGLPVYRNQQCFLPATMTLRMEFRKAARTNNSPSRVFTVPDDCSTDDNDSMDDHIPQSTSAVIGEPSGHHSEEEPLRVHQMDGAVEPVSPQSDVCSISPDEDMLGSESHASDDEDDESIRLTDEDATSAPPSPVGSEDLDGTIPVRSDRHSSPLWDGVPEPDEHMDEHVDEHMDEHMDEHADEDSFSDGLSSEDSQEDDEGSLLYESDAEELDANDPIDADFDPDLQEPMQPMRLQSHFVTNRTGPGFNNPVLSSIATAVCSQSSLSGPYGYQLSSMLNTELPRKSSPSDAVLPLSRHHVTEERVRITAESLGQKSGKSDFFEAREHNKMTISRLSEQNTPSKAQDVLNAAAKTTEKADTQELSDVPARAPKLAECEDVLSVPTSLEKPASPEPVNQTSIESERKGPSANLLELAERFLNSPKDLPSFDQDDFDNSDWEPGSAYELHQLKLSRVREGQEAGPSLRCLPVVVNDDHSKQTQKYSCKGKRKAAEISGATEEELAWREAELQSKDVSDTTPLTLEGTSSPSEAHLPVPLSSPPTTPREQEAVEERPTKRVKKIAERLGYAALGGATVGAMVLTSLIYTAPSFA